MIKPAARPPATVARVETFADRRVNREHTSAKPVKAVRFARALTGSNIARFAP